ncbi:MAG: hypothetical protein IID36_04075 [Planctomycetes bacterium]|nr:hypothetical protein [Planctomycetota bacterium]
MPCKNEKLVARFLLLVYAALTVAPSLHLLRHARPISLADCRTVDHDCPSLSAPCENANHHHDDHHDEHQCSICRVAKIAQAVVSPAWQIGEIADGTLLALRTVLVRHDIDQHAIRTRAPPFSCNS